MFRSQNNVAVGRTESGSARLLPIGAPLRAVVEHASATGSKDGGALSVRKARKPTKKMAEAVLPEDQRGNIEVGTVTSAISTDALFMDVLFEFVQNSNNNNQGERKINTTINRIYRDMYHSDSITGSAVDLYSVLPFSEFTLTGLRDERALAVFTESCERSNIVRLMPHMSRDHMVVGAVLACMSWDEDKKLFNGISPQNLDNAFFTPVPVYGADPLINLEIDVNTKAYLSYINSDKRAERYKKFIPDDIMNSLNTTGDNRGVSQGIPLDPDRTLFIPRQGLLSNFMGMSFLRRALPAWLIEKAFIRGTMDQGYKRQRAITHITIGDVERPATAAEMEAVLQDFLDADSDPVGAIVATRANVNVNDVRRGDDFFKWQDVYDQLSTIKLRAMGLSESFVTGEATYSNMEQSLSLVMDQIRSHRSLMTHEVFNMRMFPAIAKAHNFTAKRYRNMEVAGYQRIYHEGMVGYIDAFGALNAEVANSNRPSLADYNPADYAIPQVIWLKRLMPEADRDYMDMLQSLEEKGIPVPIRMIAAAGGLNLRTVIEGAADDLKLREQIFKLREKVKEFQPKTEEDLAGETEMASVFSGVGSVAPKHFFNREYLERDNDVPDLDSRGKRRVQRRSWRKQRSEKVNKLVSEVAAELGRRENYKAKLESESREPVRRFYFRRAK